MMYLVRVWMGSCGFLAMPGDFEAQELASLEYLLRVFEMAEDVSTPTLDPTMAT